MPTSSRPLGIRSTPEVPIPQFSNWVTALRTVTVSDASAADVPDGQCINLDKSGDRGGSRFPLNAVSILVKVTAGGGTLTLYAREKDGAGDDQHFLAAAGQAFTDNKVFVFKDLPPLKYVPVFTGVSGTIEVSGGGTY